MPPGEPPRLTQPGGGSIGPAGSMPPSGPFLLGSVLQSSAYWFAAQLYEQVQGPVFTKPLQSQLLTPSEEHAQPSPAGSLHVT